jgi:putative transcriptional regulator
MSSKGGQCGRARRGIAVAAVLVWAWSGALPATAQDREAPARGRFLVATRQVQDSMFGGSVVLLFHAGHGAMGLIVNRRTERRLADLVPDHPALSGRNDPVYLGGPVGAAALIVLLRDDSREDAVVGDVHAAILRREVEEALDEPSARPIRFYAGHAGWGPGQLEHEIARGDWLVVEARPEEVFAQEPAELWPELMRQNEGIRVQAPPGRRATLAHRNPRPIVP